MSTVYGYRIDSNVNETKMKLTNEKPKRESFEIYIIWPFIFVIFNFNLVSN